MLDCGRQGGRARATISKLRKSESEENSGHRKGDRLRRLKSLNINTYSRRREHRVLLDSSFRK